MVNSSTDGGASDRLIDVIKNMGPIVVALSGGVDSSLVMAAASKALSDEQILAVTADSDSLATDELDHCRDLAATWGVAWHPTETQEMNDERYLANNPDRCYWCKSALMDQLVPIAQQRDATVVLGVNMDDLGDHRPGQHAAAQRGGRFPLVEAGFTKAMIRELAQRWGLEVWDRPAMPCLSSRIPYGTEVSVALLSRIDRAERALRQLGFSDVRVRDYGDTARIEVPSHSMVKAAELAETISEQVTSVGYRYVTLDMAGLRSGNLNHVVAR